MQKIFNSEFEIQSEFDFVYSKFDFVYSEFDFVYSEFDFVQSEFELEKSSSTRSSFPLPNIYILQIGLKLLIRKRIINSISKYNRNQKQSIKIYFSQ